MFHHLFDMPLPFAFAQCVLSLFFYNFVDCPYFIAKRFAFVCTQKHTENHFVCSQNERNFSFWQSLRAFSIYTHTSIQKEREREIEENENVGTPLLCLILAVSLSFFSCCLKHSYIFISVVGIVMYPEFNTHKKANNVKEFPNNASFRSPSYLISTFPICIYLFFCLCFFLFVISDESKIGDKRTRAAGSVCII